MIEKAMKFATRAHEGQFRKGTQRPYIVHPVEVSEIVEKLDGTKDVYDRTFADGTMGGADGRTCR